MTKYGSLDFYLTTTETIAPGVHRFRLVSLIDGRILPVERIIEVNFNRGGTGHRYYLGAGARFDTVEDAIDHALAIEHALAMAGA